MDVQSEYISLRHLNSTYNMVGLSSVSRITLAVDNVTAQIWGSYQWWGETGVFHTTGLLPPPDPAEDEAFFRQHGMEYTPLLHPPRIFTYTYRARGRDGGVGIDERFQGTITVPHPESSNQLVSGFFDGAGREGYWEALALSENDEATDPVMTLEDMKAEWDALGDTERDLLCSYDWANANWMTISLQGSPAGQPQQS